LGSVPKVKGLPSPEEMFSSIKDDAKFKGGDLNFAYRAVSVWLLDFNMCKTKNQDSSSLKEMVDGFI
jgi:hypothetical protein